MGKKINQPCIEITQPAQIPISKSKDFKKNMQNFFRIMKKNFSTIQSRDYLKCVHEHVRKCRKVLKHIDQKTLVNCVNKKVRICRICEKWSNDINIIACQLCQDYYHKKCHGVFQDGLCKQCVIISESLIKKRNQAKKQINKTIQCHKCQKNKKSSSKSPSKKRSSSKKSTSKSPSKKRSSSKKSTSKSPSKKKIQNQFISHVQKQKLNKCIKCQQFYHEKCFGSFGINIVCYQCNKEIAGKIKQRESKINKSQSQEIKMRQSKLQQYSTTKKEHRQASKEQKVKIKINQTQKLQQTIKFQPKFFKQQQSTKATLITRRNFLKQFPQMTEEQIKGYKKNLLQAIYSKKMQYSEQLIGEDCVINDDEENSLDFSLCILNKKDQEMFDKYKKQPIGPFIIKYQPNMGYDVKAGKDLPKGMIVCQYIGDVVTLRKALESDDNDSRFQLKSGPNSQSTLLIRPQNFTNIARFINGINNKTGLSKQNVQSIRVSVRGKPAIILYTTKKILQGESLLYNYNSGQTNVGYDTSHYV